MALYYEAAALLSSEQKSGSLTSIVYGLTNIKSKPAQIYALISQTAKCDAFLSEVIDNSSMLQHEPKLNPTLALLLCHDHFFAKSGLAAPSKHPLKLSIERHKARLGSEFTRARLRREWASVEAAKSALNAGVDSITGKATPRWARVNTLQGDMATLETSLRNLGLTKVKDVSEVMVSGGPTTAYTEDEHIPRVFAFHPRFGLTKQDLYTNGQLILQDKASCFPAYLLLGGEQAPDIADAMDGCAAPGNKTTQMAAILHEQAPTSKVFACERDPVRSKTLRSMITKAGAKRVDVLANQDFLALDPEQERFANVTHLLLDPSCSGSGILGRQDIPRLKLPKDPRPTSKDSSKRDKPEVKSLTDPRKEPGEKASFGLAGDSKKRKRPSFDDKAKHPNPEIPIDDTEVDIVEENIDLDRLEKLSNLQYRVVEHAMKFPAARRITYSTCSIHEQENEVVVSRLLASPTAMKRGWKLLPRSQQAHGLRIWKHRGVKRDDGSCSGGNTLGREELDSCIRCWPGDEERSMGFFVCAFFRDPTQAVSDIEVRQQLSSKELPDAGQDDSDSSWQGFD